MPASFAAAVPLPATTQTRRVRPDAGSVSTTRVIAAAPLVAASRVCVGSSRASTATTSRRYLPASACSCGRNSPIGKPAAL